MDAILSERLSLKLDKNRVNSKQYVDKTFISIMTPCELTGGRTSPRLRTWAICSAALQLLRATSRLGYGTFVPLCIPPLNHLFYFKVSLPRCGFHTNRETIANVVQTDEDMRINGGQETLTVWIADSVDASLSWCGRPLK